jgi:hypothetical protein
VSERGVWACPCGKMRLELDFKPFMLAPCCLKPYTLVYTFKPAPIPQPKVET